MTNYYEDLAWLYGLRAQGMRYELERMQDVLLAHGSPEKKLRAIHVAGTNGKGSVCAMLEAILRNAGYKTGLYTSPHLHRFAERIRIGGEPIPDEVLHRYIAAFRASNSASRLTFFEATTLFAFQIFAAAECDIVVVEVGLGGRLDATNVLQPELSVITEISFDHQEYLGNTLEQIATEKAAIIKPGCPSVIGCMNDNARSIAAKRAIEVGSSTKIVERDFGWEKSGESGRVWTKEFALANLTLAVQGEHQWNNAAIAFAAACLLREAGWKISDDAMREGFGRVSWPGRLEWIDGQPNTLLDAAHNESGCVSLRRYLDSKPKANRRVLLFAAMQDKDIEGMLHILVPAVDACVYTSARLERSQEPAKMAQVSPGECIASPHAAFLRAQELAGPGGTVVVAGSIFLVAAIRAELLHVKSDPLIAM